ncbi:MAG: hypothetical protein MUC78_13880 [Bacteroidales bacterium]|jgi:hypothetical protein|nr:hypothetical protein [Bacteroidales bacterium]
MELDDFKGINLPQAENLTGNKDKVIKELQQKVEANYAKQRKQAVYFSAMLIIMAVVYLPLQRLGDTWYKTGIMLLGGGFISGAVYLFIKSRLLKGSLYSLPVIEFLTTAEKRLTYFRLTDWLVIIPIFLALGTGGGLVFISRLLNYTDRLPLLILIWVVFFIGLVIFGYFAGRGNWKRDHGALLSEIRKVRAALSETE